MFAEAVVIFKMREIKSDMRLGGGSSRVLGRALEKCYQCEKKGRWKVYGMKGAQLVGCFQPVLGASVSRGRGGRIGRVRKYKVADGAALE